MSFITIKIRGKASGEGPADAFARCLSRTEETDELMQAQGLDPTVVNRMVWPVFGASRFATCTLLMHSDDVDTLAAIAYNGDVSLGPKLYVDLLYGPLTFPQMVFGRAIPLVATDASKALFLVELHCRRWLWRQVRARGATAVDAIDRGHGYNIRSTSRGRYVSRTLNSGTPWTPKQIVERVLAGDASNGLPALQLSTDNYISTVVGTDTGYPLTDTSRPGVDFHSADSAPGLIDSALAKAGCVLAFVPSTTSGKTYDIAIHQVGSGEARGVSFLSTFGTELIAGGIETVVDTTLVSGWTTGAKRYAKANRDILRRDCPDKVRVYFPFSLADNAESGVFSSADSQSVLDGKVATVPTWDTATGRPFSTPPDNKSPKLFHIIDDYPLTTKRSGAATSGDIVSSSEMTSRAEQVGICYFARFECGAADAWFRGWIPPIAASVWTGGQVWTYELRDSSDPMPVVTHIEGSRDSDLFGYRAMSEPNPIRGVGGCTAFRGPDGRLCVIGNVVGHVPVVIRIKSVAATISVNRWRYSAVILQRDSAEADGWSEWATIDAFNTVENHNTATFAGPSYKLPLVTAPGMLPLPIGRDRDNNFTEQETVAFIVEDRTLSELPVAMFSIPNGIDGPCEE
jgi:hypothetical protein